MAQVAPDEFGELKYSAWMRFESEMTQYFLDIKEEVQSLISSSSSFLRNDTTESQSEVQKITKHSQKIRTNIDKTIKEM